MSAVSLRLLESPRPGKLSAAMLLALGLAPSFGTAATIVVTDAGDTDVNAATTCTLRQAILSMNASTLSGDCENTGAAFGTGDTIGFAPDVTTVTLADAADNQLLITAADLAIEGHADAKVTIERPDGAVNAFRVFGAGPASALNNLNDTARNRLAFSHLVVRNGSATHTVPGATRLAGDGGGISARNTDLSIADSIMIANQAQSGGGIALSGSRLSLVRSRVAENIASGDPGNTPAFGGGIYVRNELSAADPFNQVGSVELHESEVTGNTAIGSGFSSDSKYSILSGAGGGIAMGQPTGVTLFPSFTLTSENSTISGNRASAGGGIFTLSGGVQAKNTTISGNSAALLGGGILTYASAHDLALIHVTLTQNSVSGPAGIVQGKLDTSLRYPDGAALATFFSPAAGQSADQIWTPSLDSTLISANTVTVTQPMPDGTPWQGTSISAYAKWKILGTHNLFHEDVPLPANVWFDQPLASGDPQLQPLAYNGGYTKTHAISRLGAAINAAESTDSFHLGTDQRGAGFPRVAGLAADIGAFEANNFGGCGPANGSPAAIAPSVDLCLTGSSSIDVVATPQRWQWTCDGVGQRDDKPVSMSCSAPLTASVALAAPDTVFGQPVVLDTTVSGALRAAPSGQVVFCNGGAPDATNPATPCGTGGSVICTVALSPTGRASCALPQSLAGVGVHTFGAVYFGDTNYLGAIDSASMSIAKAPTSTRITLVSPARVSTGESALVSVNVSALAPSAAVPTGSVTISGAGGSCNAPLTNGAGSCLLTNSIPVGVNVVIAQLTAFYEETTDFIGSGDTGWLEIGQTPSTATLSISPNPSVVGQPVSVTGTVTGATTPTSSGSNVHFYLDGAEICVGTALIPSGAVNTAHGICAVPQAALTVGKHALDFKYDGDANSSSASAALANGQTVNAANTITTIAPLSAIMLGDAITVRVSVTAQAPGAGTPDGTVTVSDGEANCTAMLSNATGNCVLTPRAPAGEHTITASYAATTNFAASTGTSPLAVNIVAVGITLTSSANPSTVGQAVQFVATVAADAAGATRLDAPASSSATAKTPAAAPSGGVVFTDNGTAMATVPLDSGGVAVYTAPALGIGTHSIAASYRGDASHAPAQATLAQQVDAAVAPVTPVPAPTLSAWTMLLLGLALAETGRRRYRHAMVLPDGPVR